MIHLCYMFGDSFFVPCLGEKKLLTIKYALIFHWAIFSFDYGLQSLLHCFNKLPQCQIIYKEVLDMQITGVSQEK